MKWFSFLLLFCLGEQLRIEIIGTVSISDLFCIVYFLCFLFSQKNRRNFYANKDFHILTKAYLLLLFVTLCTELVVGNNVNNMMKGLAIIVLSYMKLVFMWQIFSRHKDRICKYLTCTIICNLLFTSPEEASVSAILSGEAYSFFKFRIAPRIAEFLVVISLLKTKKMRKTGYMFILAGAVCIVLGARSTGLMTMLTGVFGWLIIKTRRLSGKTLLRWSIPSCIILYGLYVVYVNAVLSNAIIGGNSHEQFQRASNPYNPINILMMGRTEMPASTTAIIDKPITGHGAWAPDPRWKYHIIELYYSNQEFVKEKTLYQTNIIPAHSVVLQTGVNNGIIAMGIMIFILCFVIKRGWTSLNNTNPLMFLVIFSIMQLVWNGMFSPLSHFRGMFPFYFTCCLMSYKYNFIKDK